MYAGVRVWVLLGAGIQLQGHEIGGGASQGSPALRSPRGCGAWWTTAFDRGGEWAKFEKNLLQSTGQVQGPGECGRQIEFEGVVGERTGLVRKRLRSSATPSQNQCREIVNASGYAEQQQGESSVNYHGGGKATMPPEHRKRKKVS